MVNLPNRDDAGDRLARAALDLVGCRFRLHGRDPLTGLDCLGVLAAALDAIGRPAPLPADYPLHSRRFPPAAAIARNCGLHPLALTARQAPGEVRLVRPSPLQQHLAIAWDAVLFVHADAASRRVVLAPLRPDWPIIARWHLTAIEEST